MKEKNLLSKIFIYVTICISIAMISAISAFAIQAVGPTVDLKIMSWYPQGSNYVFVCDTNFAATTFDFSFGDGQRLFDMKTNNVYHTFMSNGEYEVACTASNGTFSKVGLLRVGVGTQQTVAPIGNQSAELTIAPYFPQGPNGMDYVFDCNAYGFSASSYDWDFGDGQKLYDMPVNNVFHRFDGAGPYLVNCAASNSVYRVGASKLIAGGIVEIPFVNNETETPVPPANETLDFEATLSVAPSFPQFGDYVFVCDTTGITPTSYDWVFGDGFLLNEISSGNVWHTYMDSGIYDVSCTAKDEVTSAQSMLQINATVEEVAPV